MDVDYVVSNSWWDYLQGDADIRTTCACRHGHYNFGGEWPHMVLPKNSFFIFDSDNVENAVRGGIMRLCEGPRRGGLGREGRHDRGARRAY